MKKIFAMISLGLALSACGPTEKKEDVSQEMIEDTKEVESVTIELEESSAELEEQMQKTENVVDSLLNDI